MKNKSLYFLFIVAVLAIMSCGPEDPRRELFNKDEANLDGVALQGGDTLSESLAAFLKFTINEDLEPSKNSYFTRISEDGKKLLVLIKMPKLKDAKKESRKDVVAIVQSWQAIKPSIQPLDLYLGVKGKYTWMITKAPGQSTESSLVVASSDLFDFYGPRSDFEEKAAE